jgi:hypothetical protein
MTTIVNTVQFAGGNTVYSTMGVGKCWTQIAGVWLDETTDINSSATADVPMGGAVNDEIYFGFTRKPVCMSFDTSTAPTGTVLWERYGSGGWTSTGVTTLPTDNATISFPSDDFVTTQVNSESDGPWYYVRMRRTGVGTGGTLSSLSAGVQWEFASAKSITIPDMTSPRNIRFASLRIIFGSSEIVSLERLYIRGAWDGGTSSALVADWTTTNQTTHGESWSHILDIDITSITSTAWASGNSHTFSAWFSFCGRGTQGSDNTIFGSSEIIITYDQDDTSSTHIKTIKLPVDSLTGAIGTSQTLIGQSGDWPNLSSFLPESSISGSDTYLQYLFNTDEAGTTDWSFYGQIDTETETLLATFDASQQSDLYTIIQWIRNDVSYSSAHDIKARVTSATGATLAHAGALLTVTYTFTKPTENSTVLQQLIFPHGVTDAYGAGTTESDQTVKEVQFNILDANPSLVRAGSLVISHQSADPGNLLLAFGSQSARTYTVPPASTAGPIPVIQRWDSGGIAGSGISFVRGRNTLTIKTRYDTTPANGGGMSAVSYILYSCSYSSSNKTTCALLNIKSATSSSDWATGLRTTKTINWNIPDASSYAICCVGYEQFDNGSDAYSVGVLRFKRGASLGWVATNPGLTGIDTGLGVRYSCMRLCPLIKCYTNQPTSQYEFDPIGNSTDVTCDTPLDRTVSAVAWLSWHNYTYTVSGNITNSSGGTVTIKMYNSTTDVLIMQTTRVGNGSYSFTWFDNVTPVYVIAQESNTSKGVSKTDYAGTGNFDIILSPGTRVSTF